jgi:RND family efflux transporter MFP subunit
MELAQARQRQAEARLAQLEARRRAAEIATGYATLRAPFAGFVTERLMDPGSLAAPGTPILLIDQIGEYRLEASVPEGRAIALAPGQTVTVRLDALDDEIDARITEVSPAVDPGSRTVLVRIALPPHASLRSGMFGRALFAAGESDVLTVPEDALLERGQVQSVFVVEENVARRRLVSLGARSGGRYRVLAGLRAEDTVIVDPGALDDGAPVRIERARTSAEERS